MKKKRMLGLIGALMIGAAVVFSGCGSSGGGGGSAPGEAAEEKVSPEDEATACIDGFFGAMQAGELSKLTDYCSEDVLADQDLVSLQEAEDFDDLFYESLDLESLGLTRDDISEEAQASITNMTQTIIKNLIGSYEITDVSVKGDTAEVTGTLQYGYDTDFTVDTDAINNEVLEGYYNNNMDALMEVYNSEGEGAMMIMMLNDIMPELLSKYTDALLATEGQTDAMDITVTQTDGKWMITDMTLTPES